MSTMKSVSASVSSLSVLSDTISEEPGKINAKSARSPPAAV